MGIQPLSRRLRARVRNQPTAVGVRKLKKLYGLAYYGAVAPLLVRWWLTDRQTHRVDNWSTPYNLPTKKGVNRPTDTTDRPLYIPSLPGASLACQEPQLSQSISLTLSWGCRSVVRRSNVLSVSSLSVNHHRTLTTGNPGAYIWW